jgi:hypothetical protein
MGWLFYHRPPGQSDRDHFAPKLGDKREIVACATVHNVFYAAVRDLEDDYRKPGEVWAFIALLRRQRGEFNFGYKDMSETMGPVECNAPARVLDALTPTDNEYALEWREECRKNLAKAEERKKVRRGSIIELPRELGFGEAGEASLFEYQPENRRQIWWALDADHARRFRCRLGGDWATRFNWKLVKR